MPHFLQRRGHGDLLSMCSSIAKYLLECLRECAPVMLDVCLCLWKRDVTLLKTTLLHSAFFPCKDVLRARVLKWNWAQIKLCATEWLLIICGTFSWQPRRDFWDTHMRPGGAYFQPTLVPQGTVELHYPSSPPGSLHSSGGLVSAPEIWTSLFKLTVLTCYSSC